MQIPIFMPLVFNIFSNLVPRLGLEENVGLRKKALVVCRLCEEQIAAAQVPEHNIYCQLIFQKCERQNISPRAKLHQVAHIIDDLLAMSLANTYSCLLFMTIVITTHTCVHGFGIRL